MGVVALSEPERTCHLGQAQGRAPTSQNSRYGVLVPHHTVFGRSDLPSAVEASARQNPFGRVLGHGDTALGAAGPRPYGTRRRREAM